MQVGDDEALDAPVEVAQDGAFLSVGDAGRHGEVEAAGDAAHIFDDVGRIGRVLAVEADKIETHAPGKLHQLAGGLAQAQSEGLLASAGALNDPVVEHSGSFPTVV